MKKVAAIQMTSSHDTKENLNQAARLIEKAAGEGACLAVLPEMFPMIGKTPIDSLAIKEPLGNGPIQGFLAEQAAKHRLWLVGGTLPLESPNPKKVYAACLVFNAMGECVAHYNKMHLFDVSLSTGETYQESETIVPGENAVVVDTPAGKLGLAVCYDIRFPELFRVLFNRGAEIFSVPAAFTVPTGKAHWEILLRARAIENFSYVIGAGQTGSHANGRKTYGNSMIIEPWGTVVAHLAEGTGVITAEIDLNHLQEKRRSIPVREHQKISTR